MFNTATFDSIEGRAEGRRWSTVASFTLQAAAVGALLVFPLLNPESLPQIRYAENITAPTAPRAQEKVMEIVATEVQHKATTSEIVNDKLITPRLIPIHATTIVDPPDFTSNSSAIDSDQIVGAIPTGTRTAMTQLLRNAHPVVNPASVETRGGPMVVSHLDEGSLVRKVLPVYPSPARLTHVQGPVVLAAVIDKDGRITSLRALSGHPYLITAAMDAVKQWRYRPYVLNGQPIEVETQITVMFNLQ